MDREMITVAVIGALAALVIAQAAGRWWEGARRRLRTWKRTRRAERGEAHAERLLVRAGFKITDRQVERAWSILVNGEPEEIVLRADLLVSHGKKRFVAEVKTGQVAPRIQNASTRRQLLEYLAAYPVDGVLLVDMEEGEIKEVVFPLGEESPALPTSPLLVFAAGALVGAIAAAWWLISAVP